MSHVYDALRQQEKEQGQLGTSPFPQPIGLLGDASVERVELDGIASVNVNMSASSRLVALSAPHSLGAEKFRVLVTRLENLCRQKELKSLQITSAVTNEGKTFVAANLAVTLAKRSRSRVLLVEGDLHRPALATLLGLNELRGLSHWWSDQEQDIVSLLRRLNGLPLWFLGAGTPNEMPSHILQSTRFAEAFERLICGFEWIIVDSTPMLPIADANLWSGLVDGTLLVVREGVTPVRALRKGLQALDDPKLVGLLMNETSESDERYAGQYYTARRNAP